jgi:uncharacterized protein (DUF1501 family)
MSDPISRRELLKWFSAGAGAAAVGGATWYTGRTDPPSTAPTPVATNAPAPAVRPPVTTAAAAMAAPPAPPAVPDLAQRLLVVVEMGGGNDGMSTLVPYGLGGYYDLRPNTALGGDSVLALDGEVGFHADLARTFARGAAVLQGVGVPDSDGSHFEMMARWWAGAMDSGSSFDTGFLGRLADAIGDPAAPAVALSVGSGSHPALVSRTVGTLSIPNADSSWYITGAGEEDWLRMMFQQGFTRFGQAASSGGVEGWKRGLMSQSVAFAELLDGVGEEDEEAGAYPESDLGRGLRLAARLFTGDIGLRIVHVPMNLDFDTHDDHNGRYPALMQDFDASVDAFFADLEARGLADRVLLATTSEFGRTARDNASYGLDHGTASNMLLMGPVVAGRHGEHPSLDTLDDNGNLVPTVGLDQYYATIAEHWFGVPASEVLAGSPAPVAGIIA